PLTKMPSPDSVDEDPGRQGIGWVDNRLGQLQTAAALLEGTAIPAGQYLEEPSGNGRAGSAWIAPDEDSRLDRPRSVFHDHGAAGLTRGFRLQPLNGVVEFCESLALHAIQNKSSPVGWDRHESAGSENRQAKGLPLGIRERSPRLLCHG